MACVACIKVYTTTQFGGCIEVNDHTLERVTSKLWPNDFVNYKQLSIKA